MDAATEAWKALIAQGVLGTLLVLALLAIVYLVVNGRKDAAAAAERLAQSQEARIEEGKEFVKLITTASSVMATVQAGLERVVKSEDDLSRTSAALRMGVEHFDEKFGDGFARVEANQQKILDQLTRGR